VPTLYHTEGIKLECYSGDHPPPHLHVTYAEYEVLIEITTLKIYAGNMPRSKLNIALNYIKRNQSELLIIFNELNPHLKRNENE
jgi:hypothetical protein